MRPFVVLSLLACSLFSTPAFAAWDIFQSYVIIDAGSGNQFLAGGYNGDAAATFGGSDLGTFAASDALTLNGGELKTYKNGSSNVCGGNVYYRVYASGDTPGSFSSVALPYDSELANAGDQKWDETAAGIDLLAGLTAGGAYTLEVYWDLAGADNDPAGCGETKYDTNFGNNFTASFTFNVPGCTDPNYLEYDANANADDGSCATLMAVTNENTSATYATIQAAIDAATAGDVLTLAATTFNPTGTVTVDKPLTINGAGSGSTTIDVGGYNAWGIYITANDVTLSGVTIQGDAVANQQFALKAGTGNNTGGSTSICENLTYSDIVIQGTKRTAIDLNGVDGATLTDITATGATGGFGMSISSSANVTVTNLTTSGNAWGDVGIFPANSPYQWPTLEGPTGITFGGTIDLSSGAGSISVQDGSLQSGGTWTGTISNDAADGADVTVPAAFSHVVNATRDADGLVLHNVGAQAAIHALGPILAANGFSGTTIDDLDNGDIEVVEGLSIQDAIDAASAGDVIEIADGSYAIATPILVNKAVTLQGQSEAGTVLTCEAALGGANSMQVTAGATLKDFTVEANSNATFGIHVQPGTDGAALSGLTINNTGSNGIGLSGVTNATVSDIAGSGNVQYILGIAGSVGVSASDISGGNVGVYKGTGTYAQSATDIVFTGTFNLAGGFVIEQLAGADEITYAIDGSAADVQIPAAFDRVFFANYTSVPLPPPYNEASLATLVEAGNLATAIGTAQALDAYGYGLEGAAVYNLTADQWEVSTGLAIQDAIDRADAGDVIDVAAGTFAPETTLAVDKSLTINGAGSGSTTIDVGGYNAWGIYITANDVTLSGVTIQGDAVANQQFALKAGTGNNTGGSTSICENLTYSDIVIQGTKRTAIDLNGVDGATLTDITATGATGGFGMSISSSANVTVTNLTTSGNAWGDVGIFPANSPYQWPTLEGPTGITFGGTIDLSSGAGSISVQDGSLQSGGTWTGTISNDAADGADVTVPAAFSHVVNATRDADGLVLHNVGPQAAIHALGPILAANGFSGTTIDDLDNGDIEVVEGLSIQDAIDAASAGDVIEIADGSYAIATPILVNKAVTLQGQSEAGTVLTCEAALGGANSMQVTAGATLKDFTVEANSNATFGIHVQPGTDGAALSGLTINNTGSNGIGLSGVTNATVSDIAGSGNVQYILGIAGSVGVSASDISGGNVGVYKGTGTYAQSATDIVFTGTFNLAGGFVIEQLAGADEITYAIDGSAADVQIPAAFDRVFFANYTSVPLPPPYNEASLATLVEAGNLATAIGTAQALDAYGYGLEGAAVYNLTADQWEVSTGLAIQDAIDRAEAGDAIDVAAGTYAPETTLAVDKSLTINGAGSGSTTIDVGGYNAWGIYITANDVTLSGVTIQGDAVANQQFALKAGTGNNTGGSTSICENLTYSDIVIQGTKRTAIDLNGVDGATLTDITATGATGGFGMSISSSANVTVTNLTTSGNAWGDVGIFPANSPYQWPTLEGPTGITFGGTIDLSSGAGSISVQDGSLQSGGTWTGTISNDAADGADVTVPAAFSHVVNATRDADGLVLHNVGPQAAIHALGPILAANGFSGTTIDDLDNGDIEVVEGLLIQDAIDAASAGDVINVSAGTYEEDLALNKGVTINGPNAGIAHDGTRGAEAIIDGEHNLSAAAALTLDGIEFLSNNPAQTSTIFITTAAGHAIQNNRFVSSVAGGGSDDKALYTAVLASGSMTIAGNSFSGDGSFADGDRYSSAAWGRGIWLNGGGAAVTISGNAFTNCRTGATLENYFNDVCAVDANTFTDCGTGMSLGVPTAGALTSITGNSFQDVDTDINARNLTADITWDLAATANAAVPGNSTYYSDLGLIPGNNPGDLDDPNGNLAYLSGSGADNLTFGADDNTVTGDYGGAADDFMNGGGGNNIAQYGDNLADLTLTGYGDTLFVSSPTAGNDILVNFGSLACADQVATIILGCTDAAADNYNATATVNNLSCQFLGCTNSDACNFDPEASTDDGSCEFSSCTGCRNENACNYDPAATLDGPAGTCTFPAAYYLDCNGNCLDGFDLDNNGTCDPLDVPGCMNSTASNYNELATVPDGSCQFDIVGCIQPDACNYNPSATMADVTSTCIFPAQPYLNCQGSCINDANGDGICDELEVLGCTDSGADNYNAAANTDDGSCFTASAPGCMIPSATNYDPAVTVQGQPIGTYCTFSFINPPMLPSSSVNCADSFACNYNPAAAGYSQCEYTSCLGCTIASACNYDASAIYNDGSCEYTSCVGCTASGACNYDATASINDGSCEYTSCAGCMEPNADNYDVTATIDDGSCEYLGCTNISACNYGCTDPAACAAAGEAGPNTDDGSCEFTSCAGCMTSGACNYDATATIAAACEYTSCAGCTDNTADNYDPSATIDSGNCEFEGCTVGNACNYDATANVDDGSCTYPAAGFDCDGNCLDLNNNGTCDSAETPVPGCTNPAACNYDPSATQNDGSCTVVAASANNITVQLDVNGVANIVPADVDNGSGGGCTVASSTVTPNTFDVDDLGANNAVLTVTDDQGNSATGGFVVTVQDLIPPVASANDITIAMTSTNQEVILTPLQVSTSTDNAGIESQTLSKSSFFGCDDVTTHVVTLTVTDFAGNTDQVNFNVTITHPDVDADGICDDQDNCTDLTANNYNDPANGVCQPCGTAPVFLGLLASAPASNLTENDGVVTLDITSGAPITLQLTGLNGTPDYSATIPTEMGTIPAGLYEARVIDADGCLGVASAPGGSTFGQPSVYYTLIMPYTQCCGGCGVFDADMDGICDDSDNCIDKTAPNYDDPANDPCAE